MCKKQLFLFIALMISSLGSFAQIDTLAFQNFEVAPSTPNYTFTGGISYNQGFSSSSATPANSPIGVGGSRAWHVVSNSAGLPITFANQIIPSGYDSIRFKFNLAAMNLTSSTGGPDNLDYVLVEYSLDGGANFISRIRVRGAVNNNCSWSYAATQTAKAYYLPNSETVFAPTNTGLVESEGFSTVELVFPGTITQVQMRIIVRSSSSTDDWLLDNALLIGENLNLIPLPVTLKSFNLNQESKGINSLTWKVSQEENLSHYELQRSENGIEFSTIATIKAKNSVGDNTYSFNDNYRGQCYYRIKMVDIDDQYSLSTTLKANYSSDNLCTLSPNPIYTTATLQTNYDKPAIVQVLNIYGSLIATYNIDGKSQYSLDFSTLSNGVYSLKIIVDGISVENILFQKL